MQFHWLWDISFLFFKKIVTTLFQQGYDKYGINDADQIQRTHKMMNIT